MESRTFINFLSEALICYLLIRACVDKSIIKLSRKKTRGSVRLIYCVLNAELKGRGLEILCCAHMNHYTSFLPCLKLYTKLSTSWMYYSLVSLSNSIIISRAEWRNISLFLVLITVE